MCSGKSTAFPENGVGPKPVERLKNMINPPPGRDPAQSPPEIPAIPKPEPEIEPSKRPGPEIPEPPADPGIPPGPSGPEIIPNPAPPEIEPPEHV
jgi:hypothetical protein